MSARHPDVVRLVAPEEIERAFGAWLARQREACGYSQRALGECVGMDGSRITRIEKAQTSVRYAEAVHFAHLFAAPLPDASERPCVHCYGQPPMGFKCIECGAA